ncbi:MAG: pentapeptide repeat-containing protein [Chroococcidiopsidaceae cyanobacterium CP_BM_ER_R8_30]|nr:pentapeptide repeat-containing protein [Chroococcidiopsidaceae cyanobacterium CP_BM_ER_R8_30]
MKANEVLKQYKEGKRKFHNVNLRGESFRGTNLSEADFSNADFSNANIQGADFTKAILTGANFSHAKAGLQRRWAIAIITATLLLSILLGWIAAFPGLITEAALVNKDPSIVFASIIILITLVIFFLATIYQGLVTALGAVMVAAAVAVVATIGIATVTTGNLTSTGTIAGVLAMAVTATVVAATTVTIAGNIADTVAMVMTMVVLAVVSGNVTVATNESVTDTAAIVGDVIVTLAVVGTSAYIGWRALAGDEKYAFIRGIAIALTATRGTSFHGANLTGADFTSATLQNTDFRDATLTRTCWKQAEKLSLARLDATYLKKPQIRNLVTGKELGEINFDNQDLQRLNLGTASLINASFIGADFYQASLRKANLTGAILVRTQLDQADLTGATLTEACIEKWGATNSTKLDGVICEYVYMKFVNGSKQERMPPKREFKDGEFIAFARSISDTLDLYHEQYINPIAAVIVLKSLSEDYNEFFQVVGFEKRGNGSVLKLKTPEWTNQEKLTEEYYTRYSQTLSLSIQDPEKLLSPYDELVKTLLEKIMEEFNKYPTINTKYLYNEGLFVTAGSVSMNIDRRRKIEITGGTVNASGANAFGLGDVSGTIVNLNNQSQVSSELGEPRIKELLEQLKIVIESDDKLTPDVKDEALEEVEVLEKASQDLKEGSMHKEARRAIRVLEGIILNYLT